ncbi:hypothetical protein COO60DRAFT_792361 [Scenedesmus sp. NREL 46B-D3]|nr:hypothetical protein COO60DRAFT_792361 [Scenedesmus sp. NREL 46B-D3]
MCSSPSAHAMSSSQAAAAAAAGHTGVAQQQQQSATLPEQQAAILKHLRALADAEAAELDAAAAAAGGAISAEGKQCWTSTKWEAAHMSATQTSGLRQHLWLQAPLMTRLAPRSSPPYSQVQRPQTPQQQSLQRAAAAAAAAVMSTLHLHRLIPSPAARCNATSPSCKARSSSWGWMCSAWVLCPGCHPR